MEPSPGAVFDRIARVLLPSGGHILVLVEAYFDESGTHSGSDVMALGGYLMRQDHSEQMAAEWREFLANKGLPFFHMVDCAHGNPPFKGMTWQERTLIATRLIGLIKKHTIQGLGIVLDLGAFHRRFGERCFMGTPYCLLFYFIIRGIALWADKTRYDGEIAYFFEAGTASQSEANQLLGLNLIAPELRQKMRYGGHAFVEKAKAPQVQAADMFAWHLTKDVKNKAGGRLRRKDFVSLLGHQHNVARMDADKLDHLIPIWDRQRDSLIKLIADREARRKAILEAAP